MLFNRLRALSALISLAKFVRDPSRLGEVFEISDALAKPETLAPMIAHLSKDQAVARSFEVRHRIRVDIPTLRRLPKGTLGREFAEHMIANGLDPRALPTLPSRDHAEYFRAHLYETHDIWHVVAGFSTDLVGELGLQAFYLTQIPGPLPALLVAIGFLRSGIYDEALTMPMMEAVVRGHLLAKAAVPLFGVRWDEQWELPLEEVRSRLRIATNETRRSDSLAA